MKELYTGCPLGRGLHHAQKTVRPAKRMRESTPVINKNRIPRKLIIDLTGTPRERGAILPRRAAHISFFAPFVVAAVTAHLARFIIHADRPTLWLSRRGRLESLG